MTDVSKLPDEATLRTEYNEQFKTKLGLNKIAGLPERTGWCRKGVITNYPASAGLDLVRNYERHLEMGYQLLLSTEAIQDERKFSPNSNARPNGVPSPIIGKTSDGYDYVVMEIEHSKLKAEFERRNQIQHAKILKSTGGKMEQKVHNTGESTVTEVKIQDSETKF